MNEIEIKESKDIYLPNEDYSKIATQIYTYCVAFTPAIYKKKKPDEMKLEIMAIERAICEIPIKIVNKMIELAINKYKTEKIKDQKLVFNIDFILGRYACAEYLVRNNMESFDEEFDDIDDFEI